jgi:hypothetical protein
MTLVNKINNQVFKNVLQHPKPFAQTFVVELTVVTLCLQLFNILFLLER